jgi:hypothetical protein
LVILQALGFLWLLAKFGVSISLKTNEKIVGKCFQQFDAIKYFKGAPS